MTGFTNLPEELSFGVSELENELNISADISVTVERCDKGFSVEKTDGGIKICYCSKKDFFRALTFINEVNETGDAVSQHASFSMLCYMVDISRNAVLNMNGAKELIRTLAMMGYDSMMLYTEDTYEIPDYPYFGHMRGRYTEAEMRELDDYAYEFGIELIPCMQTLAHLSSTLRWGCFANMTDTPNILLADCDDTYAFIDSMLKTLSKCFRTKRIHLGMDEAHDLGLGKYLDKHGYQDRFSILSKHLARVKEICDKYGLSPMIWGDMYFRLYNHGTYYMTEGRLPQDIIDEVPKGVGIVYWDYYSTDVKRLDCMFENHKAFDGNLIFAGGAWKWSGIVPFNRISNNIANLHIDACLRHSCDEIIVTGWGDNGAEASQFSTLPTLSLYAERCYDANISAKNYEKRFESTFGIALSDFFKLDIPNEIYAEPNDTHYNPSKYLLYNGVLNGLLDLHVPENAGETYKRHAATLDAMTTNPRFGYMFETLSALCSVLETKAELSKNIKVAYAANDRDTLRKYADEIIPDLIGRITNYLELFRIQWYKENKTLGFDVQETRLGALKETLRSAALRLESYLNGEIAVIEELIQPTLPFIGSPDNYKLKIKYNNWSKNTTASIN